MLTIKSSLLSGCFSHSHSGFGRSCHMGGTRSEAHTAKHTPRTSESLEQKRSKEKQQLWIPLEKGANDRRTAGETVRGEVLWVSEQPRRICEADRGLHPPRYLSRSGAWAASWYLGRPPSAGPPYQSTECVSELPILSQVVVFSVTQLL